MSRDKQIKATQALGRLPRGTMNKLESRYALYLEELKHQGVVLWYYFEGMTFRLAKNTSYLPDFVVLMADGQLQCHEVKGRWMDAARVKIKVAAALFPIQFIGIQAEAKCRGGGWKIEMF